jgi:hypothetical protein
MTNNAEYPMKVWVVIGIVRDLIIIKTVDEISNATPAVRKVSILFEIEFFLCSVNTAIE